MREPRAVFLGWLFLLCLCAGATGAYKDDIGYTQLLGELGGATPTGDGITVSQVEADESGNYLPDETYVEFVGKTIIPKSGSSGASAHATNAGRFLYGTTSCIAPDIMTADCWEADHWLGSGSLKSGTTTEPALQARKVQNHSWVGTSPASRQDITRRFDYTINRDNYLAVVGVRNDAVDTQYDLLANSYNAVAVGRSDGNHHYGDTTFDVTGRMKPDIVAPASYTSYATPMVGAAGALLYETALGNPSLADADNSEAVKAILLAGATKDEFPAWSRTTTRPLDPVYGAGELNIYNSYHILTAGQHEAGGASDVGAQGWDFDATPVLPSEKLYYFFELTDLLTSLSAVMTWNRVITDGQPGSGWGNPQASVANLDLQLYTADGYSLGDLVDSSLSTVDNVEHVYQHLLQAGRYVMEVSSDTASTDFALAWFTETLTPIPGDATLDGVVDAQDFTVLKANYGQSPAGWTDADFNDDNLVDAQDFTLLKAHYGDHMPEPASLLLLLAGAVLLPMRRRRSGPRGR